MSLVYSKNRELLDKLIKEAKEAGVDDIHTHTASKIYNIPITEVTKEQRKQDKLQNFKYLYS